MSQRLNSEIAIIGGGVAGMGAAYNLAIAGKKAVIFEKEKELGGDTFGVEVFAWDGSKHIVDGGVSDFNQGKFPNILKFLDLLKVESKLISRETGFMDENQRLLYFVTDSGKMTFWQEFAHQEILQADLKRFREESMEVLSGDQFAEFTIQQYLELRNYSDIFWKYHLRPRALGCFSMHREKLEDFPIRSLVSFLEMHSIVGPSSPGRICLVGGMSAYCKKFKQWFEAQGGVVRLKSIVQKIERSEKGVRLRISEKGEKLSQDFSYLIMANKPNEVVKLFQNPSPEERSTFAKIPFSKNRILIHTDSRLLPRSKRAWGAYNLTILEDCPGKIEPTITRWQNNLSDLDKRLPDVFMSMNPAMEPDPHLVIQEKTLVHPVGSFQGLQSIKAIKNLQGKHRTWFCGSYTSLPYLHENAYLSGKEAAQGILRLG